MIRQLLSLFLVLCLSCPVVLAREQEKPFLAVFCNPDQTLVETWVHYKPDLFETAFSWDQFDTFLKLAKKRAKGRHIDLDIEVHGNEYLTIDYRDNISCKRVTKYATMGYVLNHVEKILGTENVTVMFESCYGAYVYKKTIRDNCRPDSTGDYKIENHKGIPKYPVYGGTYSYMNVNNFVYIQYKTNTRAFFCDMRFFEDHEGGPRDDDEQSEAHRAISETYDFLSTLYVP